VRKLDVVDRLIFVSYVCGFLDARANELVSDEEGKVIVKEAERKAAETIKELDRDA
jgi:hypothetical protein